MSLPPVTVHIKRKFTDEPVDYLRMFRVLPYLTRRPLTVLLQAFKNPMEAVANPMARDDSPTLFSPARSNILMNQPLLPPEHLATVL